jgi:hypothetical protein
MRFRYWPYDVGISPSRPEGILYRPVVPVRIIGRSGSARLLALVDTGSDDTLFARSIGETIGARIDQEPSWAIQGIGGHEIGAARGEIEIEISDGRSVLRWLQPVGFLSMPTSEDELAVLGHAGFLQYFRASFDSERHELTLRPNRSFPARA